MECPACKTPNPANASKCGHCDTPFESGGATLSEFDDGTQLGGSFTPDNWSAAVSEPAARSDAPSGDLEIGSLLVSRYQILQRIGGGGMGTVYKAQDREVDRLVALKVIRGELADDSGMLSRFKQELILARKVTHKNVIRIFDLGRSGSTRFITMEYIEGQDLRDVVRKKGKLSQREAVDVVQQVCLALEAAHTEGIVHRDLKPPNIMVDPQNRVYVMDFGIARSVGSEGITMNGALVGTPDYMSPEQVKGEDVDGRSDIFALGIILYELLTGKMPYKADTLQKSMYKRTVERAVPAAVETPGVDPFLSEVVSKCLEIAADSRYASARELWTDLEKWRNGETGGARAVVPRLLRLLKANRTLVLASSAVVVIAVALLFFRNYENSEPPAKSGSSAASVALAVFPFRNASGDAKLDWLGTSLGEMLTNDIGQSAKFRTISEGLISQVMHDLRINPDTPLDSATMDRLVEFTNADLVVSGQYARFGEQIRIDGRLMDRKNNHQTTLKVEAANEKDLLKSVELLAEQVRNGLSLSKNAISELQTSAFKPSSNSIEALRAYDQGLHFERIGKSMDARDAFLSATKLDPGFALAFARLGEAYARLGQDDPAQTSSLKAVELSQKLPEQERYVIQASHDKIVKEYPKAIDAYEKLAKVSPGDTDILFELASLYENAGNMDKSRGYLEKVHVLEPKRIEVLLAQGRVELKAGNPQKGLEYLNTALNLAIQLGNQDEAHANILQAIGSGYSDIQKPEDALRNFQDSLAIKRRLGLKSGIAASLNAIANTESQLGKRDEALKDFSESLAIRRELGDKTGIGDVLIDLGNYYVDLNKPNDALKLYKESLQMQIDMGNDPKRGLLLNNIGNIYLGNGAYEDAHTYFEQALTIREKFNVTADVAETLHNLGETATNLGLYDQALNQYQRALDLQRKADNKQIAAIETSSMGTVFGLQGRYGAALSAKEEALKTFIDLGDKSFWRAEIQAGYGNALAQVGRFADADKNLTESLALSRELKNDDQIAHILAFQGDAAFYRGDLKASHLLYLQAAQSSSHSSDRSVQLSGKFNLNRIAIDEGRGSDSAAGMASLADDARKIGLKYLSAICSIYESKALLQKKKPDQAKPLIENTLNLADKMGIRAVETQCHLLLAKAAQMQGDAESATSETALASRLLSEIQQEGHFGPTARYDLALQ